MSRGKVIVLSGPSGVGKTTICDRILAERPDVRYSVSATSRPKRTVEKDGREYIFLSIEEFNQWITQGRFVEYAEVYGNLYGTPKKSLEDGLNTGFNILMDVDVQGARRLMNLYPDGIYFYIIPPDIAELERRLKKRDTDKDEVIKNRIAKAMHELGYRKDYRYVIENKNLQTTVHQILRIIEDELGVKKSHK
ncbi:MAG: guanylate kinase [candidate division WOR-3 bacterium]|nr:MAG: guanylate kinase [candidate division WOR-3 bacterium]